MWRVPIKYRITILLFLLVSQSVTAVELFGIQLNAANHDELSRAAKQAGVKLIREGGETKWFDVFDSQEALAESSHFYLGYVKQDRRFAFAEYEFAGLSRPLILKKLSQKYGQPEMIKGQFISDQAYRWIDSGIEILLRPDWQNYRTRLSYVAPAAMQALREEQLAYELKQQDNQLSAY